MILRIKKAKSNISGGACWDSINAGLFIDAFAISRSDARPSTYVQGVNKRPKIDLERDDHMDLDTPLVADGKSCITPPLIVAIRIRPCEHQERKESETLADNRLHGPPPRDQRSSCSAETNLTGISIIEWGSAR